MTDDLLISQEDFQPYKDISENMDGDRMNQIIWQAQIMDLRPFLGNELYYLLEGDFDGTKKTFTDPIYTALFNGTDYNNIRYYGLQPMLVQFAYARLLSDININLTRTGARMFDAEESEPVTQAMIATKVNSARSEALVYQADAEQFLIANNSDYPTWESKTIEDTGFKFFKV